MVIWHLFIRNFLWIRCIKILLNLIKIFLWTNKYSLWKTNIDIRLFIYPENFLDLYQHFLRLHMADILYLRKISLFSYLRRKNNKIPTRNVIYLFENWNFTLSTVFQELVSTNEEYMRKTTVFVIQGGPKLLSLFLVCLKNRSKC